MRTLGNFIWFLCGGAISALGWTAAGVLWCLTILGIPVGLMCFKIAGLTLFPFKKTVIRRQPMPHILLNILWMIFGGIELAIGHILFGAILCLTIVGIPFGKQHFKLAGLALMPFGAEVVPVTSAF